MVLVRCHRLLNLTVEHQLGVDFGVLSLLLGPGFLLLISSLVQEITAVLILIILDYYLIGASRIVVI